MDAAKDTAPTMDAAKDAAPTTPECPGPSAGPSDTLKNKNKKPMCPTSSSTAR